LGAVGLKRSFLFNTALGKRNCCLLELDAEALLMTTLRQLDKNKPAEGPICAL